MAIDRLEELERLPEESGEESMRFAETPDVEIDNITFRYVEGEAPVFSHFSCKFPAGSCTAVMGETGRGKTTLVRMLLALALPEGGEHCTSYAFTVAGRGLPRFSVHALQFYLCTPGEYSV